MDHDDENNENDVDDGNNDVECNVNNHNDDDHDNNNRLWEGNSGCRFVFYGIRDNNINETPCWTKLQRFINSCKVNSSEVNLGRGLLIVDEHPREVWRSLVTITFPDCEI